MKNSKVKLIGILNITPDSFSDGGEYFGNVEKAVGRAVEMVKEGADIIDIGGESTRPGAERIAPEEELKRILPVIKELKRISKKTILSVDTYNEKTARKAIESGAYIINSMGGFRFDSKLADSAADSDCKIIVYHIKGVPRTMQIGEIHYDDVIEEIKEFFGEQINYGIKRGMRRDQFILDPGIGFGKTVEQNIEIIRRLKEFEEYGLPVAIGISRKSHLGKILQYKLGLKDIPSVNERLEAGLAETAIAILNGAEYVRTHDIAETRRFLAVLGEFIC